MADFERDMVHCLNRYFEDNGLKGYAYRLKQSKYNTQYVDILVDSLNPQYYLAVECKSLKGKKIYFKQHFHEDKDGVHQIDAIKDFIGKTGRKGFLAVEFRSGGGKPNRAFMIQWQTVLRIRETAPGISLDEIVREGVELTRSKGGYVLEGLYQKELDILNTNGIEE